MFSYLTMITENNGNKSVSIKYTSNKVAARVMIITTYEILKKELQGEEIFKVATGWQIAKEADSNQDVRY